MLKDDNDQIPLFEMVQVKENKKPVRKTAPEASVIKKLSNGPKVGKKNKFKEKAPVNDRTTARKKKVAVSAGIGSEKSSSGQVPEGDVRLTANIREDLHLKLKIMAARRRTTIGELLEELVDKYI